MPAINQLQTEWRNQGFEIANSSLLDLRDRLLAQYMLDRADAILIAEEQAPIRDLAATSRDSHIRQKLEERITNIISCRGGNNCRIASEEAGIYLAWVKAEAETEIELICAQHFEDELLWGENSLSIAAFKREATAAALKASQGRKAGSL